MKSQLAEGKFIPSRDVFESEAVIHTNKFVGLWSSSPPGMRYDTRQPPDLQVGTRHGASTQTHDVDIPSLRANSPRTRHAAIFPRRCPPRRALANFSSESLHFRPNFTNLPPKSNRRGTPMTRTHLTYHETATLRGGVYADLAWKSDLAPYQPSEQTAVEGIPTVSISHAGDCIAGKEHIKGASNYLNTTPSSYDHLIRTFTKREILRAIGDTKGIKYGKNFYVESVHLPGVLEIWQIRLPQVLRF